MKAVWKGRHRRHHLAQREQKMNRYEISSIFTFAAYNFIFNLPPPPTLSHRARCCIHSQVHHMRPEVAGWAPPV